VHAQSSPAACVSQGLQYGAVADDTLHLGVSVEGLQCRHIPHRYPSRHSHPHCSRRHVSAQAQHTSKSERRAAVGSELSRGAAIVEYVAAYAVHIAPADRERRVGYSTRSRRASQGAGIGNCTLPGGNTTLAW
jgi:hypothetical protein